MTLLQNVVTVAGAFLVVGGVWQWRRETGKQPVSRHAQALRFANLYQWGGLIMIGVASAGSFLPDLTRGILSVASIGCTVTGMVMRYRAPALE